MTSLRGYGAAPQLDSTVDVEVDSAASDDVAIGSGPQGVNFDDLLRWEELSDQEMSALMSGLQAQLDIGALGVGLSAENLGFQRDVGMREIAQAQVEGLKAAGNNALQRGIFNSGIRVGNQQDVIKQAGEAKADLQRGITLGLQELQLRVAELQNNFAMGLGQAASQLGLNDLSFYGDTIGNNNISGGFSGVGGRADNTNPANIAAAQAGEGPYGARVQLVSSFASQWRDMFPGIAIQGDNYFRPPSESTPDRGRSTNSDHITGGALDIFVRTPQERAAFNAWYNSVYPQLQSQGLIASVVEVGANTAHNDHMHISFALGAGGGTPAPGSVSETHSVGGGGMVQ